MKYALPLGLIALALVARLIPHPDNFTPMLAVALFGGALLPRRAAYVVPLAAMLASDWLMGHAFDWMTPVIYGCFAVGAALGQMLARNRTWSRTGYAALAGSVFFFLATNFAVWVGSGMYPLTAAGLVECYAMALPFFQNTLAGVAFYSLVLFGGFALLELNAPKVARA